MIWRLRILVLNSFRCFIFLLAFQWFSVWSHLQKTLCLIQRCINKLLLLFLRGKNSEISSKKPVDFSSECNWIWNQRLILQCIISVIMRLILIAWRIKYVNYDCIMCFYFPFWRCSTRFLFNFHFVEPYFSHQNILSLFRRNIQKNLIFCTQRRKFIQISS